jgi:hypothetical protein
MEQLTLGRLSSSEERDGEGESVREREREREVESCTVIDSALCDGGRWN